MLEDEVEEDDATVEVKDHEGDEAGRGRRSRTVKEMKCIKGGGSWMLAQQIVSRKVVEVSPRTVDVDENGGMVLHSRVGSSEAVWIFSPLVAA